MEEIRSFAVADQRSLEHVPAGLWVAHRLRRRQTRLVCDPKRVRARTEGDSYKATNYSAP